MDYFYFKNKDGLLGGDGYPDMGQNEFWGDQAGQMGQQYDPYFGDVGMDVNQGQQVQNPIQQAQNQGQQAQNQGQQAGMPDLGRSPNAMNAQQQQMRQNQAFGKGMTQNVGIPGYKDVGHAVQMQRQKLRPQAQRPYEEFM